MNIVEFPGLWGLKIPVSRSPFSLFGIDIYWYGICIAVAFLVAVILALKDCSKYEIKQDDILDLVLVIFPMGMIGARIYYVIFSWDEFKDNLINIINIRMGGLAIYGGIIAGVITAYVFAKVKKIKPLRLFDFGMPYVPLAQAIGRWGNFFNQEAFGINTDLPWGMTSEVIRSELSMNASRLARELNITVDPSKPVHPTFLYESLWDLGVFFILIWYRNKIKSDNNAQGKQTKPDGEILWLYLILYGIGRAWIEGLRIDSLLAGGYRISQVLSIIFVIAAAIIMVIRRRRFNLIAEEGVYELGTSNYGNILREFQKIKNEEMHYDADEEVQKGEAQNDQAENNNEAPNDSEVSNSNETSKDETGPENIS